MANPNIVSVAAIYASTTGYTPPATTSVVLLANPAGSGKVYKVNQVVAANTTTTACNATLSLYSNGAVAQGGAPSGGTEYPIVKGVAVPGSASLICVAKETAIYVGEGQSLICASAVGGSLTYTVALEDIS